MDAISRRSVLARCALGAATLLAPPAWAEEASLDALAARSGRFFGSAVTSRAVVEGGEYGRLLDFECGVWTPEWELKWGALSQNIASAPDFTAVDALVDAARRGKKRLRGHALLWHEHLPKGAEALTTRDDWDRFVAPHIRAVAGRYPDAFFQWDVVNEAIAPDQGGADFMRRSPFHRMLGPDYVEEAFRLAHHAAPSARLYLNDYDVCYADDRQEKRRIGVLRLLERLLGRGAPVHGFGVQGHLQQGRVFNERVFRRFIDTIASLGLEIAITELDVQETFYSGNHDIIERRARCAEEVSKVLAPAMDSPALTGVVTWGLADHDSWLRKGRGRPDNQGLPYDDSLRPTMMRAKLADLFEGGKKRG